MDDSPSSRPLTGNDVVEQRLSAAGTISIGKRPYCLAASVSWHYRQTSQGHSVSGKRVLWGLAGAAVGALSLFCTALFITRWLHATHEGHSAGLGLHVDLISSGASPEGRSYSAILTNYGFLAILVATCDAVTDTLAHESTLAYSSGVDRQRHHGQRYLKCPRPPDGASRFRRE